MLRTWFIEKHHVLLRSSNSWVNAFPIGSYISRNLAPDQAVWGRRPFFATFAKVRFSYTSSLLAL